MTRKQKNRTQNLRRHQRIQAGQQAQSATPQPMTISYGHTPTQIAIILNRTLKAGDPILLTVQQARDMQRQIDVVVGKLLDYRAANYPGFTDPPAQAANEGAPA